MQRRRVACTAASVLLCCSGGAWSQSHVTSSPAAYPSRPVRIVTGAAGGTTDISARMIANGLSSALGQQVVVESRGAGSAGGALPTEVVIKALPDGHTLLLSSGVLWMTPLLREGVAWDPVRDFAPITLVIRSMDLAVVTPSLPVKTVRDLIALAKARPGVINYGSSTAGSSSHLAPELFKSMARVNIVRIPYRGTTPALGALAVGEVQLMITTAPTILPHLNAKRVRALAVASLAPSPAFPDLPTISSSGVPGYESGTMTGLFAPAHTPDSVIGRLNQETVRFLQRSEVKQTFYSTGSEPVGSRPEQLTAAIKAEMAKYGKLIRDHGIRSE